MSLTIKPKSGWDLVSSGEVMLRFDPGEYRIWTTRNCKVSEGSGEYNVARGLKRCLGLDTAVVTAFAKNPLGLLLQDLIYEGGVDSSLIGWVDYDGVGRTLRNGLNFTERGFGVRSALGCSDRGHTAVSALKPGKIDWDSILASQGASSEGTRWFHTGGKKHAQKVNRGIASYVDVMLGDEEDFSAAMGYEVAGMDENLSCLDPESFQQMMRQVVKDFPFNAVATTLRKATTGTSNDGGAICCCEGDFFKAKNRENLEILDRVGGGDSFASGLIYGFLAGNDAQWAVECGAAHAALAMTTPGDTSMATLTEVLQVMKGAGARIAR